MSNSFIPLILVLLVDIVFYLIVPIVAFVVLRGKCKRRPSEAVPSGWYKDPSQSGRCRWWNGEYWTMATSSDPSVNHGLITELPDDSYSGSFQSVELSGSSDARWWEGREWTHGEQTSLEETEDSDCGVTPSIVAKGAPGHAGWYPDPKEENDLRWWDGAEWIPSTTSTVEASKENPPQTIECLPAIKNWKTSVGFSILGLFLSIIALVIIEIPILVAIITYLGKAYSMLNVVSIAAPLSTAVMGILGIVYALVVYPSYFTQKPLLKSSRVISLANIFFGNIIFGCIWNYNLSQSRYLGEPKQGASYAVFASFSVASICTVAISFFLIQFPTMQLARSYYEPVLSQEVAVSENTAESEVFSDPVSGISFSVPAGWKDTTDEHSVDGAICVLEPEGGNSNVMIGVMVSDVFSEMSAEDRQYLSDSGLSKEDMDTSILDEEYIRWYHESGLTAVDESNTRLETIGGKEYWVTDVTGTESISGVEMDCLNYSYLNMENGVSRVFMLSSANQSDATNQKLEEALREIVESAKYN